MTSEVYKVLQYEYLCSKWTWVTGHKDEVMKQHILIILVPYGSIANITKFS